MITIEFIGGTEITESQVYYTTFGDDILVSYDVRIAAHSSYYDSLVECEFRNLTPEQAKELFMGPVKVTMNIESLGQ